MRTVAALTITGILYRVPGSSCRSSTHQPQLTAANSTAVEADWSSEMTPPPPCAAARYDRISFARIHPTLAPFRSYQRRRRGRRRTPTTDPSALANCLYYFLAYALRRTSPCHLTCVSTKRIYPAAPPNSTQSTVSIE